MSCFETRRLRLFGWESGCVVYGVDLSFIGSRVEFLDFSS